MGCFFKAVNSDVILNRRFFQKKKKKNGSIFRQRSSESVFLFLLLLLLFLSDHQTHTDNPYVVVGESEEVSFPNTIPLFPLPLLLISCPRGKRVSLPLAAVNRFSHAEMSTANKKL